MMFFSYCVLLLLISVNTTWGAWGERLHEQIYSPIEGGAACFRRLNGTHQAGCSSADNGAVGAVQMIKDVSDVKWLVNNSMPGPNIAVVSTAVFNRIIWMLVDNPSNIAGVLLFDNATQSADYFSQDLICPNEYSSPNGSQCLGNWNAIGSGLMRTDIPFPIFYLPSSRASEIETIEECYNRYNLDKQNLKGKPLCSVQLTSFMYAAVNTEVCLRRSATSALLTPTKVCDPLGDYNVYYSLFPRVLDGVVSNVTFVTARIDSASLFDGVSPGAGSSVVGMVTLLAAAATLAQMIPATEADNYDANVLWTLFNGESFDYIGSDRVAYDISNLNWPETAPLAAQEITLHVEVGQIGGSLLSANDSWEFHAFTPVTDDPDIADISEFMDILSGNTKKYNMSLDLIVSENIPPSSLYAFRKFFRNLTDTGVLPEMVLVDHRETFTNFFYNSALDTKDKIGFVYRNITIGNSGEFVSTDDLIADGTMKNGDSQVKIARFATALAHTLYQRVTGKPYTGDLSASAHLIDEMLYCFLESQVCQLLLAAEYGTSTEENVPTKPAPLYVGVSAVTNTVPVLAGHLLALLTGIHLPVNKTDCINMNATLGYSQYWLKGWNHSGVCVQTTMNFSQALSPAFSEEGYDWSSGLYSTWTESVWQTMSARVFVTASGGSARTAAVCGFIATVVVAVLTFWLQKHAKIVFNNSPVASTLNDDAASGILRAVNC